VGAAVHYPTPVHLQPGWGGLGLAAPDVPNAEALARSVLSLPLYSQMTPAQVDRCVTALDQAVHA
jgi:dTDP-4-amino-4,6-dideoxygalactose transaminase